ncbi:hypothetical protein B0H11DRAFT_2261301 [Mycena galericulata]|nr:hypothetical protein B0H11DRAFT_2261301 [Mycena galericulata]
MPYEFFQTCSGIPLTAIPASGVERTLQRIISTHSYRLKQQTEIHHMDTIVGLLLSLWKPESPTFESAPWIVEYISSRDSDETLSQALQSCDLDVLRSCMTAYLQVADFDIPTDNLLITIWRLCILSRRVPHPGSKFPRAFDTTALRAVQQTEFSLYSVPVIALIQCDILESVLQHRMETPDDKALLMAKLRVPILPGSTLPSVDDIAFLSAFRDVRDLLNMRYTEACFTILSDFLDGCNSPVLPHSTREAIEHITAFVPRTKLHASHQRRFASSLRGLVQANTTPAHNEIISRVMHSVMFNVYVRNGRTSIGHIKYLDDPEAQEIMGDALRSYVSTIPPGQFPTLVRRVTAIVSNINRPEFEQEPPTLQVSSSRRSFTHILGAEYRLLRPTR